jgi:hypothetical protein
MGADVGANRRDERRHAAEGAPAEALACDLGEEALDEVQPGGAGWREVEMKSRVLRESGLDHRMLVRAVVVENQMDCLATRVLVDRRAPTGLYIRSTACAALSAA